MNLGSLFKRIDKWWEDHQILFPVLVLVLLIVGVMGIVVLILAFVPQPKSHCESGGRALYTYETCGKSMCYRFAGCEVDPKP
jgi:hypothetical protein